MTIEQIADFARYQRDDLKAQKRAIERMKRKR